MNLQRFGLAGVAVFFGSAEQLRGQGLINDEPLIDLQQKFNAAFGKLAEPVTKLNASYAQALKLLFDEETEVDPVVRPPSG